ncbi:MAG: amino acid ABC transporter [Pseudomonadota bacterium]
MSLRTILLLAFMAPVSLALAEEPLRAAINLDIPPYVMNDATDGLEVAIVKRALPGQDVEFVQMPFNEINRAIASGTADLAVSVAATDGDGIYSDYFITFENYAISHEAAKLEIKDIPGLAGRPLLTWQGAYFELGPEFEAMYGPGGPEHANYIEIADLQELVVQFWRDPDSIAVIDHNVFRYFTDEAGETIQNARLHDLFAPGSNFRVGFGDADVRNRFDEGLAQLCQSGEYGRLLERYKVELRKSVCED